MSAAAKSDFMTYLRTYSKAGLHMRAKPVSTSVKVARILPERQRGDVVRQVTDILLNWRASPFEFEGAAVAGLRAQLCLKGYGWTDSNAEALLIVGEALRTLGAERPSWQQGQREYTIAAENCKTCGGELLEDQLGSRRRHFYCSEVCAKIAYEHHSFEHGWKNDTAGKTAWLVLRRAKNRQRICKQCQSPFRPQEENRSTVFCSPKCNSESQRSIADRVCEGCDTTFRPKDNNRVHCSRACFLKYHRERERICEHCGTGFTSVALGAKHCSSYCKYKAYRARKAAKATSAANVVTLTADIFDVWFSQAA